MNMKTLSMVLLPFAFLLASLQAGAVVDMKNANYADTWTDLVMPGTGYDLRIRRTYNSRSLFNGMFGFGWCSDFETSIEPNAEGNLKLTECGAGQKITYTPRNFSINEIDKTISQIVSRHKKSRPGLKPSFLKDFRSKLKSNDSLRNHYAKLYQIKVPVKQGTTFYANGREVERIKLQGNTYTRYLTNNTIQKFDLKGRLIFMTDKNNNHLKFNYSKANLLKTVTDNNGRQLSFNYIPGSKRLKSVTGPNGLNVFYKFDGDNLAGVKNAWKNSYTYGYDDLHNLTLIKYPDKTTKILTYNKDQDWVTSFKDRSGCRETYKYIPHKDDPKNHYTSTVEKKCKGKITAKASYEFWHKTRKDGVKYLARVRTSNGTNTNDVTYHEVFGRPTRVGNNGIYTNFEYLKNGLVAKKSTPREVTLFSYKNSFQKVSKVTVTRYNAKRKVEAKLVTDFAYDKKGNLKYAKNSRGQTIKLSYDRFGRIATIEDQAKKLVKIKYEKRFGKPSFVQRPGVGAITVTYKSNGDIRQVASKEGPTVAVQVASTFNNLLEIIAPATEELSL